MTVWRTTGDEDGLEPGDRVSPGRGPRYDVVELDTPLLRVAAAATAPRLLLSGEVDVSNARDVTRALGAARDRAPGDVHVDMAAVEFVDVAGLRAFTLAACGLQESDRLLVLHSVAPHIERLFHLIGWCEIPGLEIHCHPAGR
ncbi:anti-anti-sigma factor [Actinomadura pelletieri DSM 43383]|uniref:Anti-anti-sigma factor n=1 Tax=Actinomadura pelletieri DSM 43383 TaxID=1120940 RepID=A0A495QTW6_9ACTN|nr:STAS domain-containing protein [Actinomadura pelletieri]RKS76898.1 anti-anti-sigma factor [Actinomadura pelletieri DSM 43383]